MSIFRHGSLVAFFIAGAFSASAQVNYTKVNSVYTQDFNNVAGWSGTSAKWTDNSTIPGWFAAYYNSAKKTFSTPARVSLSEGQGAGLSIYRDVDDTKEGALGSQSADEICPDALAGGIFYGVQITNKTDHVLTQFSIGYRVELWRLSSTKAVQATLMASYKIGGGSLTDGAWSVISGTSYTTPRASIDEVAISVDGNKPENQVQFPKVIVTGVKIPPGESVWIRWFDVNNRLLDHGAAIDDFTFSAAP